MSKVMFSLLRIVDFLNLTNRGLNLSLPYLDAVMWRGLNNVSPKYFCILATQKP
jgi:hypothetical protein